MFIFLAAPEFKFITSDKETIEHLTMIERTGVPISILNNSIKNILLYTLKGLYELGDVTHERIFNIMFCLKQNKFYEYHIDRKAFTDCIKELTELIPFLSKDESFVFILPSFGDNKKFKESADFLYETYIREEIPVNAQVMKLDYTKVLLGTDLVN